MTKKKGKNLPISATLDALAVGEMAQFPLHQLNSVKNTGRIKQLTHETVFTTHMNRESHMLEVTRIS